MMDALRDPSVWQMIVIWTICLFFIVRPRDSSGKRPHWGERVYWSVIAIGITWWLTP
jgi:hypothetical protein